MFGSIAVWTTILLGAPGDAAEPVTVERVFDEAFAVATRLKSVDFVFSFEEPNRGPRAMRVRFREGKIRGDAFFGPYLPDAAEGQLTHIYDGKVFLGYGAKARQLGTTENPTDVHTLPFDDPLCASYEWLMTFPMMSCLQTASQSRWRELASRAELMPMTVQRGVACRQIRIPGPSATWIQVEIAEGLRIPLRWAEYDAQGMAQREAIVQEWKEYPTSAGTVILPIRVDSYSRLRNKAGAISERKLTQIVDLATVRVNPTLGEEVFDIPLGTVKELYNHDTKEQQNLETGVVHQFLPDHTYTTEVRKPARFSRQTWLMIAGLNVAIFAGLGIWLFSRNRGTSS